jgi:hypothetical protein
MKTDENPIIQEPVAAPRSGLPKEEVLALLRERVMKAGHPTVKQEYGTPRRGVETGLDDAFIIDRATYEALIKSDPKSEAILKPYAMTNGINRWRADPHEAWLIHTAPGTVNIEDYPAVQTHLARFRDRLEKRSGARQWFELEQAEHLVPKDMAELKIVYQDNVNWPGGFTLDKSGAYYASSGYHLRNGDYYIAGLLNSKIYWFLLNAMSPANKDGVIQVQPEHLEALPVPRMVDVDLISMVGMFSDYCHRNVQEWHDFYNDVVREMATHLTPGRTVAELSTTLRNWHVLSIDALREESRRLFAKDLPEDSIQMWEDFLSEAKYQLNRINVDITNAERKLDMTVYEIFELTEEEMEYLDAF